MMWSNLGQRQCAAIEQPMKKLGDLCLQTIGEHLPTLSGVHKNLAPRHKEQLLQWLTNHDYLTPEYLPFVTYNLFQPGLRKVNFYKCTQITDDVLKILGSSGCKLSELRIHGCTNVSDKGIQAVTVNQHELEKLTLIKLPGLTSQGLGKINSKQLHTVDLRDSSNISNDGIKTLVRTNPVIKSLVLIGCNKLKSDIISTIALNLAGNLECLDLAELHIMDDEGLRALAQHCPNLLKLDILGSHKVTGDGITTLCENCKRLQNLDLSYCTLLGKPPDSSAILQLPETLQSLSLCGTLVDNADLLVQALTRLPALSAVRLCGVPAVTDESLEQVLQVIGPQMENLDLCGSTNRSLTDHALRVVSKYCTNIQCLSLSLLRRITCEGLVSLLMDKERAANIRVLLLSLREITEDILYMVAESCPNLEELDLAGVALVDDAYLQCLAENCPKIEQLRIKGCKKVTDTGVCAVIQSCPLRSISLSGIHNITDASILTLANCRPYLEEVYLNGCTQVSQPILHYLVDRCLTRLYVSHKIPNQPSGQLMAKNLDTGLFCRVDVPT